MTLAARDPIQHELKCWPEPYDATADGRKNFEHRRADRDYRVGDTLLLRRWDPVKADYTGESLTRKVQFILDNGYDLNLGFIIMGLADGSYAWRDMSTAPRDGSLLRLLVEFDAHSLQDSIDPVATIGHNNFKNDEIDEWKFAGWCWTHDHYTEGVGRPVGWLPFDVPYAELTDAGILAAAGTWAAERLGPEHMVRVARQVMAYAAQGGDA